MFLAACQRSRRLPRRICQGAAAWATPSAAVMAKAMHVKRERGQKQMQNKSPKRLCLTTKRQHTLSQPRPLDCALGRSACPKKYAEMRGESGRLTLRLACNRRRPQRQPAAAAQLSKRRQSIKGMARGAGAKFHPFECIFENAN